MALGSAGAADRFLALVDRLGIPVLTTWLGLDLIADDHPLHFGRPGGIAPRGANFTLQNSDLLLVIGARMDMALTAYAHDRLARGARKVMVDIDATEIAKMRTPIHLPVVADAGDFIDELMRRVSTTGTFRREAWIERCRDWRERYPLVQPSHRESENGVSMYHFSEVLSDELQADDIVSPGSSGFASELFLLNLKVKRGQRVFHNRGTGAMGFGLPASIGACIASGRRRTVCVDGDGGFQMNIQELATVASHALPIKFFVVNNRGFASIRASQRNYFDLLVGGGRHERAAAARRPTGGGSVWACRRRASTAPRTSAPACVRCSTRRARSSARSTSPPTNSARRVSHRRSVPMGRWYPSRSRTSGRFSTATNSFRT